MHVDIVDRPSLRAAAVEHRGAYAGISDAFAKLGEIAGRNNLFTGRALMVGLYHDDPETTPEDQLRSHAGLLVPEDRELPSGLEEVRLPRGRYAHTSHRGPYDTLPETWKKLMGEWFPQSGHRPGQGMSYEVYLNTPADTAPPDLQTDLYVPLE